MLQTYHSESQVANVCIEYRTADNRDIFGETAFEISENMSGNKQ